ncbi:PRD domain-containing protein [Microbacterium sp. 18062]|uniref:PRD domain-containing protein n=1 Tax=Microbacterium sp. 18062 TaxID=2681410 RepID=UPI001359CB10|nr:PRD domain-containing protein [Microbacterium sp. 18062]
MRVRKVLNNSVVLGVDEDGAEAVLVGAGLGYELSQGMEIDAERVERTFVPGNAHAAERLMAFAQEIPAADVELTEEIVSAAADRLGLEVTEHLFVPLADHLSFALQRARAGAAEIEYPLRWEVQQLYPVEVQFAHAMLDVVRERSGVTLPAGEVVPLALHFVNAQFGATDLTAAMQMTEVLTESLQIVGEHLGIAVDEDSLPVARLVTHLRYLFLRQQRQSLHESSDLPFENEIRGALPTEHECALGVAELLARRWGSAITSEEIVYLTLHIGRLSASLRAHGGDG